MSKFMLSMGLVLASLPAFSGAGQGVEPSRPTQVEAVQTAASEDDGEYDDIGPYQYAADANAECDAWRARGSEADVYMEHGSYYVRVTRPEED